ncbi:FRG domain-containing protein [Geodermatophilus amargosae]|uniref:FRG domain-containing protein n=1 Tax=Geodermatophilus amargosae TaxID=1296565 RepID=UPI0034DF26BF
MYGIDSWVAWRDHAPRDLRPTRRAPGEIESQPAFDVSTYRDLATVVSFLNVMNKHHHLLFRGQSRETFPSPTLTRDTWATHRLPTPVRLVDRRADYYEALGPLSAAVTRMLAGRLPRHRPFEKASDPRRRQLRVAPWAVIQHYELWPTPLLDLTGSLRVAASFAFGVPASRTTGLLYVFSAPRVVSDLMPPRPSARRMTVRLSAVCPPGTQRPHLQDGYLVGDPQADAESLDESARLLSDCLVAVFRLHDGAASGNPGFWDEDFPPHTAQSLLPTGSADDLAAAFDTAFTYRFENGVAVVEHH